MVCWLYAVGGCWWWWYVVGGWLCWWYMHGGDGRERWTLACGVPRCCTHPHGPQASRPGHHQVTKSPDLPIVRHPVVNHQWPDMAITKYTNDQTCRSKNITTHQPWPSSSTQDNRPGRNQKLPSLAITIAAFMCVPPPHIFCHWHSYIIALGLDRYDHLLYLCLAFMRQKRYDSAI